MIVDRYKLYWSRGIISLAESAAKIFIRLTEKDPLNGKWSGPLKTI